MDDKHVCPKMPATSSLHSLFEKKGMGASGKGSRRKKVVNIDKTDKFSELKTKFSGTEKPVVVQERLSAQKAQKVNHSVDEKEKKKKIKSTFKGKRMVALWRLRSFNESAETQFDYLSQLSKPRRSATRAREKIRAMKSVGRIGSVGRVGTYKVTFSFEKIPQRTEMITFPVSSHPKKRKGVSSVRRKKKRAKPVSYFPSKAAWSSLPPQISLDSSCRRSVPKKKANAVIESIEDSSQMPHQINIGSEFIRKRLSKDVKLNSCSTLGDNITPPRICPKYPPAALELERFSSLNEETGMPKKQTPKAVLPMKLTQRSVSCSDIPDCDDESKIVKLNPELHIRSGMISDLNSPSHRTETQILKIVEPSRKNDIVLKEAKISNNSRNYETGEANENENNVESSEAPLGDGSIKGDMHVGVENIRGSKNHKGVAEDMPVAESNSTPKEEMGIEIFEGSKLCEDLKQVAESNSTPKDDVEIESMRRSNSCKGSKEDIKAAESSDISKEDIGIESIIGSKYDEGIKEDIQIAESRSILKEDIRIESIGGSKRHEEQASGATKASTNNITIEVAEVAGNIRAPEAIEPSEKDMNRDKYVEVSKQKGSDSKTNETLTKNSTIEITEVAENILVPEAIEPSEKDVKRGEPVEVSKEKDSDSKANKASSKNSPIEATEVAEDIGVPKEIELSEKDLKRDEPVEVSKEKYSSSKANEASSKNSHMEPVEVGENIDAPKAIDPLEEDMKRGESVQVSKEKYSDSKANKASRKNSPMEATEVAENIAVPKAIEPSEEDMNRNEPVEVSKQKNSDSKANGELYEEDFDSEMEIITETIERVIEEDKVEVNESLPVVSVRNCEEVESKVNLDVMDGKQKEKSTGEETLDGTDVRLDIIDIDGELLKKLPEIPLHGLEKETRICALEAKQREMKQVGPKSTLKRLPTARRKKRQRLLSSVTKQKKRERRRERQQRQQEALKHTGSQSSISKWQTPPRPSKVPKILKDLRKELYKRDEERRIIIADFSVENISKDDKKFLIRCFEDDSITVIVKGLGKNLDPDVWTPDYIFSKMSPMMYHHFRRYKLISGKNSDKLQYEEKDWISMSIGDYKRYIDARISAIDSGERPEKKLIIKHKDTGKVTKIDVIDDLLYLIDLPLSNCFPELDVEINRSMSFDLLPGGENCLLSYVSPNGRPAMGPNIYITPPGSYTWFHQDGHGTVDSGHLVIEGRNQVVMLRGLSEGNKAVAVDLLREGRSSSLNRLPHDTPISSEKPPRWPTKDTIKKLSDLGACPTVFNLEKGDYLHINKGRLHAFRKTWAPKGSVCMSVAWDWIFKGATTNGVAKEIRKAMRSSTINMRKRMKSLGIVRTCILRAAESLTAALESCPCLVENSDSLYPKLKDSVARKLEILRGIAPVIKDIGKRDKNIWIREEKELVDSWISPEVSTVDPYGVDGFECRICRGELYNTYLHCLGCETLLGRDWNICIDCYKTRAFMISDAKSTRHGHRAMPIKNQNGKCSCRRAACIECTMCVRCSCACHTEFQLRYRFLHPKDLSALYMRVRSVLQKSINSYSFRKKNRA